MRLRSLQIILWVAAMRRSSLSRQCGGGPQRTTSADSSSSLHACLRTCGQRRPHPHDVPNSAENSCLVFFGFTSCPDVCPTTLSEVAQVMDDLGSDAGSVQPLFISIDPERDRRLGLADYTKAFHPAILGLAGSEAETQAAAASFKIFYEREADTSSPDGYTMAHSPGLYPDRPGWRVATSIHLRHTCGRHPFRPSIEILTHETLPSCRSSDPVRACRHGMRDRDHR